MELKFKENDFQSFEAIPYLNEYFNNYSSDKYGGIGIENEKFLQFFAEVAHEHNLNNSLLLDFGCGPTIYSIISLGQSCREIHMSDYLQQNLEQVKLWQQGSPEAFDWNSYLRRALQIETALNQNQPIDSYVVTDEKVQQRATLLQEKITSIRPGNARATNPVGEEGKALYEAVISCFCLEGVAENLAEWKQLMANLSSIIKPGGLLIFATQLEADSYRIGDDYRRVLNLTEQDIVQTLLNCNFELGSIKTKPVKGDPNHTEYEQFLMLTARLGC
ncbi:MULTISPECIES: guanitoxin biosynthesis pre-guanitoxin forming N-methyltransferase GntF [unclassified Nodularia (in: cyanobacteria)]|uniref:guanitoxin biosynthesis pre-guanitoxin forming N-methyltransferase GntF n=1 Tax=unclassified Nodularia (in: cyanobacteria) TaxID=2656917 RepID=UPI00187F865A|nr:MULTISPECIES: guanitoxin biosynthesis pre-guanitoxin forming N-methyltransferase GntF [unclassified Nodularia (in: cyanobacteria)]MBE9200611.1 hypothetical protein [Nodularia sp. LEGE 06071]MCC2695405.1 hypothetical protein [Nodularia sp. LEGE 04288]